MKMPQRERERRERERAIEREREGEREREQHSLPESCAISPPRIPSKSILRKGKGALNDEVFSEQS